MNSWLVVIIVCVILGFLLKIIEEWLERKSSKPAFLNNAYYKRQYLLSKGEQQFFNILLEIVPQDKYHICPQVHLDCLLDVKPGTGSWRSYFNRINRKSVDFVICSKPYLQPMLAIELDDKTHYQWKRQDRDQFVHEVLQTVGLKTLRIRAGYSYNKEELRHQVLQNLL